MSWLERMGLVERDNVVDVPVETCTTSEDCTTSVDVEINSASNIVDEIYGQNNLSDKSESIYSVQEYINTLPSEMPTATKQKTVAGILAVTKKSVADLIVDASNRMDILNAARDKIVAEHTSNINVANEDIEAMKQAIETANIKIKEYQEIIASTNESVDNEIANMTKLVEFCNGMEVK